MKKKPDQKKQQSAGEESDEKKVNKSDEASSDKEHGKKNLDLEQRLRHKLSIPKVYDLMKSIDGKRRKDQIIQLLNESGFGGMVHICKWTKIHTFFVEWVVKHFEKENMWIRLSKTDVLPLKEEDVHRVYHLPMAGEQINIKLCSEAAIKRLRVELGLDGDYSPFVKVTELEIRLKKMEKPKAWVKGAICLIIHNMLCPNNSNLVSLHYAQVLEEASSYNWCFHVLQYMKDGLQNPEVANPLADFHFLMDHDEEDDANYDDTNYFADYYMEKMGKRSPFLIGKYKQPSLRDWDGKSANQDLQKVHELMGLDKGLTVGVKRLQSTDDGLLVMCFDAETCPLSKAEEHLNYYRGCIRVYTRTAETLERRIAEANASTSAKNDIVSAETNTSNEPETGENKTSSTEKSAKNDAVSEEPSTTKEAETEENKSSGTQKGVEVPEAETKDDETEENKSSGTQKGVEVPEAETKDDDAKSNDENVDDEEVEIDAKIIDDSVKAACNMGMTLTQETILKFPEFFEASNAGATPLRSVMPDEIINLDNVQTVTTKKRKKHNMLYSDSTYPERRRAVKKSKYLDSPYDDAVHESTATELQKNLSTYAWSSKLDQDELLYCSNNRAHDYSVERIDLWSLQQDEWVSCFVINVWVNCLNWNQQRDKMTRLVTPMINYVDLEKPGAFDKNNPAAFTRFIERLSKFKYLDWKTIDPNSLEYDGFE
ncbi:uncharacterized protein [Medicago truncatula]|uniref:uncharacterized protein n=1 Tax=Medicago truncatula TaxID=3880 RepID=UPI0019672DAA|nr:uncharacterized protein LOC112419376 [Medicago truncatula]